MTFPSTARRLFARLTHRHPHAVTLYGKPGCHLCEDAEVFLQRLQCHRNFTLETVDITSDPGLFRAFDIRIPVIVIDGQHELDAPIVEKDLRTLLR